MCKRTHFIILSACVGVCVFVSFFTFVLNISVNFSTNIWKLLGLLFEFVDKIYLKPHFCCYC